MGKGGLRRVCYGMNIEKLENTAPMISQKELFNRRKKELIGENEEVVVASLELSTDIAAILQTGSWSESAIDREVFIAEICPLNSWYCTRIC